MSKNLILNDETKIVKHNQIILIENDKQEDVNKTSKLNVKSNYVVNVEENSTQTITKDKETNVNENYNISVNKDLNLTVTNTLKELIKKDFVQRVKGNKITYVENDVKQKYLNNLFTQISNDLRLDVNNILNVKANTIKIESDLIELVSNKEINLKGGSNNIVVNPNGIFMNSPNINIDSSYFGTFANDVEKVEIDKPVNEGDKYMLNMEFIKDE